MKKIILTLLSLLLFSCYLSVFAGGTEEIKEEIKIAQPLDYFSGVTLGLAASFQDNSFEFNGAGQIVCHSFVGNGRFDSCLDVPATNFVVPSDNGFIMSSVDNSDGIDKTAGLGGQLILGKVFQNMPMSYYLGVYGGGQWSHSEDSTHNSAETVLSTHNANNNFMTPFFADSGFRTELLTDLIAENIYNAGALFGVLLTQKTMGYIKGGAAWTELTANTALNVETPLVDFSREVAIPELGNDPFTGLIDLNGHIQSKISETEIGYEVGAGFSRALTEKIIFSLEYVFRNFGRVSADSSKIFVPIDLLDKINVADGFSRSNDPLFYQVTQSSVKLHQSSVNAVIAYRCKFFS